MSPLPGVFNKVPEGLALPSARTRQGARLIRTFRCSTVKDA
jgi:hypothetical protein